eukprot:738236_1
MMPPEYSTGVYGAYELKRVHRYRPSVSTGVYGMYMVQPLGMTQYKIQKERKENKEDCLTEIVFKYDDKIIVSNSTAQHQFHNVLVSNPKVFGGDDYVELQHMNGESFNQFSNAFYDALTVS